MSPTIKTKLLSVIFIIFSLVSCQQSNQNTDKVKERLAITEGLNEGSSRNNSDKYESLKGTWVRHNKEGFTLIEITDTSNILYYEFIDRKSEIDTITIDRYWYYKSKATMGYWNTTENSIKTNANIFIATDKFRFDYKLAGETLIEIDKTGDQGKFIKVDIDK